MRDEWRPPSLTYDRKDRPEVGDVVGKNYRAWEVIRVDDIEPTPHESARINVYRPEYRDKRRPYSVLVRRLHGPKHRHENDIQECGYKVPAMSFMQWQVYREGRIPLCSCCHHPWPCIMVTSAENAAKQGKDLDRKMANAQPGCCHACGEVITYRQKAVTYPEPNLEIPGYPSPSFHLRQSCADERIQYEQLRTRLLGNDVNNVQPLFKG